MGLPTIRQRGTTSQKIVHSICTRKNTNTSGQIRPDYFFEKNLQTGLIFGRTGRTSWLERKGKKKSRK